MHKRVMWGTVIYVISIGFFLGSIYHMLTTWEDFTRIYLWVFLILLLFAAMFGYIFISTLLAQQKRIDENLSQLSREILHELNIPLATIQANTKMIARKLEDQKSLERIARIEASSKRLDRLYRELVYSIKKEFQPIEKESFDLQKVLAERVEVFEAFDRNDFVLEVESYRITADKIGFEKMIDNILMNAMKYSSKDTLVTLHLSRNILSIADQGVGMSETELLKIYERYYQADSSKEGEGIGLALVKSYCDSEGIDIQIKSEKNVGTTVFLNLRRISSH
ncbi:HAMP domain-containing sensor histidine kinase [Sulfurovum sp.]|jgi:signal transduction histidine kinase|uniref:sensor histidine kinase n=1 Tax=Sulfurovum sp. TaxID=1969726 RepID=UPI002A364772|nr:HAMP domain-containing sensor histidine kinase [Sulfurovum sp.]MDD2451046.1 HAMP domain-containing sensor histidine kinase [Sulfurovum sp.]MDY0403836.1 HAMP domain-containing sensor histidine kinase [Sulfurovum sp.]